MLEDKNMMRESVGSEQLNVNMSAVEREHHMEAI